MNKNQIYSPSISSLHHVHCPVHTPLLSFLVLPLSCLYHDNLLSLLSSVHSLRDGGGVLPSDRTPGHEYIPAVCGHTLVAAVLPVPVLVLDSWFGAAGSDTQVRAGGLGHNWP